MRIISLKAKNLYGSLDLNLKFYDDLNLLVGINGSGKTSALSIIDWLLGLNLPKLASHSFDYISVNIDLDGKYYHIYAEHRNSTLFVGIDCAYRNFEPISVKIHENHSDHENGELYKGLGPEKHEIESWDFLQSIKKPTIVSLERTMTAEIDEEIYYDPGKMRRRRSASNNTPLEHIQDIFMQQYAAYRYIAIHNDSQLKSRIILTALHSPDSDEPSFSSFQMPLESADQLEEKVKGYLSASIPTEDVEYQVSRFFQYFKTLEREVGATREISQKFKDLIYSQFSRVEQLARAFNTFEKDNAEAFSRLGQYLNAVNLFLKDSGKELAVDNSRGKLVFYKTRSGVRFGKSKPIDKLSSGETQIIIIFAIVAFEADEDSVFIVDEPELSLHPKWQTDFMNSFLNLCPPKSQLFVATHSPEIVAERKSSCVIF